MNNSLGKRFCRSLFGNKYRNLLTLSSVTALNLMAYPRPANAAFSLLLADTEAMMKTCVFPDTTFDPVINFFFYGGRGVIIGLFAWNLFQGVRKSQKSQNGDDNFMVVGIIFAAFLVVGFFEPAFAKSC